MRISIAYASPLLQLLYSPSCNYSPRQPKINVEPSPNPPLGFPVLFLSFPITRHLLALIGLTSLLLTSCTPSLTPVQLPPEMTFSDLASGQPFDSSTLRGKLILLNLWAAWSPATAKELPELASLDKKYSSQGLILIGVCLDDAPAASLLIFAERHGIRYPLVLPGPKTLDLIEPMETIPYTVLLDTHGKILARFRSPLKPNDVRTAIEKNL